MSNDKLATNPLFSPGNVMNFTNNSIFMPVQEQSSAILSPGKEFLAYVVIFNKIICKRIL